MRPQTFKVCVYLVGVVDPGQPAGLPEAQGGECALTRHAKPDGGLPPDYVYKSSLFIIE
jgi:hypothetical protein